MASDELQETCLATKGRDTHTHQVNRATAFTRYVANTSEALAKCYQSVSRLLLKSTELKVDLLAHYKVACFQGCVFLFVAQVVGLGIEHRLEQGRTSRFPQSR